MASEVQIRPAVPAEYSAIGEITVAAYVDGGYISHGHGYIEELADTLTRAARAEVWVAADADDRVLGSVTWCPAGSTWREIARDDEGEFRMLAVAADARGRGVGEALVRACLDRARADGLSWVAISTLDLMSGAHRLYVRLGVSRVPEADWSPVNGVCLLAFRVRF